MNTETLRTINSMDSIELRHHAIHVEEGLIRARRLFLLRALINDERGGANVHTANAYRLASRILKSNEDLDLEIRKTLETLTK